MLVEGLVSVYVVMLLVKLKVVMMDKLEVNLVLWMSKVLNKDVKGGLYVIVYYCVGWDIDRGFCTGVFRGVDVEVDKYGVGVKVGGSLV